MPTKGSIKRLLNKKSLSGADIGRLMIADLVKRYENNKQNKNESFGLFSDEDKEKLVASITSHQGIQEYSKYISIYDFLRAYSGICQTLSTRIELEVLRISPIISIAIHAETSNADLLPETTIMTQKEFSEASKKRLEECSAGIAIYQQQKQDVKVDSNGKYKHQDLALDFLNSYLIESIIPKHAETIKASLDTIKNALNAYYSHMMGILVAGELVNVEITAPLLYPLPIDTIDSVNAAMKVLPSVISRKNIKDATERAHYENKLKQTIDDVFEPVDYTLLKPNQDKIDQLKDLVTISSIGKTDFYEILKGQFNE